VLCWLHGQDRVTQYIAWVSLWPYLKLDIGSYWVKRTLYIKPCRLNQLHLKIVT